MISNTSAANNDNGLDHLDLESPAAANGKPWSGGAILTKLDDGSIVGYGGGFSPAFIKKSEFPYFGKKPTPNDMLLFKYHTKFLHLKIAKCLR